MFIQTLTKNVNVEVMITYLLTLLCYRDTKQACKLAVYVSDILLMTTCYLNNIQSMARRCT